MTLTPSPAAGSTFGTWSGACSAPITSALLGTSTSCSLTMNSGQFVSAVFNLTGFVSGIAASGSPIVGANVTLRDSTGKSISGTTAAGGAYALSTAGMTPPFLVQVQHGKVNLYSVSADALTTTTINTNPFTDLIIRSWYAVQGQDIDSAFSNPVSLPAPGPANVNLIATATAGLAQLWLAAAGVDATQFNLISSPFAADHTGLDQVLDESVVNPAAGTVTIAAGATTQTSTVTYNAAASAITLASVTTGPGGSSANTTTVLVPAQTAQQAALNSILVTLTGFFNTVNSAGAQLTADQLTPFMAADLVHDGLNRSQLAASLATSWRGRSVTPVSIRTIRSIDLVQGTADLVVSANQSEFWCRNVAGTWLIGGDNQLVAINLAAQSDSYYGVQSGSGPQINIQVLAPQGTVAGVKVTGASAITGFSATSIQRTSTTIPDLSTDAHHHSSTVNFDTFAALTNFLGNNLVPAGTLFSFAVTPVSGPVVTYTLPNNVFTTDTVSITSPTTGTLSSYTLGQPLAVQWTLPTTYALANVSLNAVTRTGPDGPATLSCGVSGSSFSTAQALANATSGTITIPATCGGQPVLQVILSVLARGINGEQAYGILSIR